MNRLPVRAPDRGIVRKESVPVDLIVNEAWSDGNNIRFANGYVEKVGGWMPFITAPSATWAANTVYSSGDYVIPATPNNHAYKCTVAGTSGGSAPVWPTNGTTVADGAATWEDTGVYVLDGAVMAIDNYYQFSGDEYLMITTPTTVYKYDVTDGVAVNITDTSLTGESGDVITTETAQNLFLLTNGVDPVQYWNGSNDHIAALPGLTDCVNAGATAGVVVSAAKCMVYFKNFLLLGGTTEDGTAYPQRVRWSQQGNIQKWKLETDLSGKAGWGDLTDGVDWVVRMVPYKDYIVVYKERSIQVLSFVGGDDIFDKFPAIFGTGLLAPKAVVDLGDEHIFLGPDNFYSFTFQEVLVCGDDIAEDFFKQLDPEKAGLTTAFVVEEQMEIWFNFVSTNSPDGLHDKAVVYNYESKAWSLRDMPMTAFGYYRAKANTTIDSFDVAIDSMNSAFDDSINLANAPINLCGDAQGYIYTLAGHSKNEVDLAAYVRTKLFDFGLPERLKRVLRIQFMISREGDYSLEVRVGTAANVDEPITWSDTKYMSLDETYPPWIDIDFTGRFFMFEFGTTAKNQPFRITGYIVYFIEKGSI